jgi:transposase InsO family protein
VVEKIFWLRRQYHFGPAKIAMYLQRYHDVAISTSGVWRILKKVGLNRLPASQRYKRRSIRWKRYEKQRPGHQLQVDVKFIEPLGQSGRKKRYCQYTAIDDCTRLRVLCAYPATTRRPPSSSSTTSWPSSPSRLIRSRPTTARSSARASTGTCWTRASDTSASSPAPRGYGKVERSHRIDSEEFYRLLEGQVIDDVNLFNSKLLEWEDYYNYHRPHGALAGQPPRNAYDKKPKTHCHRRPSAAQLVVLGQVGISCGMSR